MHLFSFAVAAVTTPESLNVGIERERWTFDVSWLSVGFEREVFFKGYGWVDGGGYYVVNLTGYFSLGLKSLWHDGTHNSFSLGFLHFCWS